MRQNFEHGQIHGRVPTRVPQWHSVWIIHGHVFEIIYRYTPVLKYTVTGHARVFSSEYIHMNTVSGHARVLARVHLCQFFYTQTRPCI